MKCSEIEKLLTNDNFDLEIVETHLKNCADCAARFAADLKLERALRGLARIPGTIDISAEIQGILFDSQKARHRLRFVRGWVWGVAISACCVIFLFVTPTIFGWLASGYETGLGLIDELARIGRIGLEAALNSGLDNDLKLPLLVCLGGVLTAIANRLWQEFNELMH